MCPNTKIYSNLTTNSAITLIALIVTIIVLLILSGITLNIVLGDNGIISKAQIAKQKTNQSQQDEEKRLKELQNKITNGSNREEVTLTVDEINQLIDSKKQKIDILYQSDVYNQTMDLSNKVTDYDYLVVFANASHKNNSVSKTMGGTSTVIDASQIKIGAWNTPGITTYTIGTNYNSNWYYWCHFYFTEENKCYMNEYYQAGFSAPKIVKIIGIKNN